VTGEAVEAVLRAVDDDGDREEPEREEAPERAEVRDPLAVAERRDRDADREPDEDELECVVAERPVPDAEHVRPPRIGGDEGQRAADPERVRDPVEDRRLAGEEPSEREPHPLVGAALLGNDPVESPPVNRESASKAFSALAAAAGIAAIITRPFLCAPIGLICLLVAAKLSGNRKLTAPAAAVLVLGALAGAAVAVGFTKPLY
jgi:hypothetical protein